MLRRFLLFMLVVLGLGSTTRATKVYADLATSQFVGNGSWDANRGKFTWTASSFCYLVLNGLSGDVTDYTTLELVTEQLVDGDEKDDSAPSFRVDLELSDGSILRGSERNMAYYSAGVKTVDLASVFTKEELSQVKAIRLNTNSKSGSVMVKSVCLVKPFSLDFGADGKAYIYPSDMEATGATIDPQTGVIEKTSEEKATITVNLERGFLKRGKIGCGI